MPLTTVKRPLRPKLGRGSASLLVNFKSMDFLFAPWRYAYVAGAETSSECLFCGLLSAPTDEKAMIVHRGRHCFIMLNAFPYTSGHVLVVPYQHTDQLQKLQPPAAQEMMELTQRMERILRELYSPDGLNLGMNLGKAGGAGVAGHIHMHVLPRWLADANFMTVIGETRVLPEELQTTYQRIRSKF